MWGERRESIDELAAAFPLPATRPTALRPFGLTREEHVNGSSLPLKGGGTTGGYAF